MKAKKFMVALMIVFATGGLTLVYWQQDSFCINCTQKQPISFRLATVGPIRDVVIAKATVSYQHQIILRSRVTGYIASLEIVEGSNVALGQQLLQVVDPQLKINSDILQLELENVQTKLRELDQDTSVFKRLVEVGGLAQFELDEKLRERESTAQRQLKVHLEISRLEQLDNISNLQSPLNGIALSVAVKQGQWVTKGQELATVVGGSRPLLVAYIDVLDVDQLRIGQEVVFSDHEDSDQKRRGLVTEIGRYISNTLRPNAVKVTVEPIGAIEDLRLSQQIYMEFIVLEEASVLRIPRNFIYMEEGKKIVYVLTDTGVVKKNIQTKDGDIIYDQIISGITDTDKLVTRQ